MQMPNSRTRSKCQQRLAVGQRFVGWFLASSIVWTQEDNMKSSQALTAQYQSVEDYEDDFM